MDDQGGQAFCYLTTAGRVSGRPHTIETVSYTHLTLPTIYSV